MKTKIKQFFKKVGKLLSGLVGKERFMPLTDEWNEAEKKEQSYRPNWFKHINTTEKNTFKLKEVDRVAERKNNLNELVDAIKKIKDNNPKAFIREKSTEDYIKCDGNKMKHFKDYVQFYAPSDTHLSNEFILSATESDMDLFDIEGDEDFKKWFLNIKNELTNRF
jgi:hypothetical protein